MCDRFTGTIECLGDVDATENPLIIAGELVRRYYPDCQFSYGLWDLEPGQVHPAHTDQQPPSWLVRIHVPLSTNPGVVFTMEDGDHHMAVGKAYRMNTLRTHAVENRGKTPRVHLVIEVGEP
jgi:hypothetical protein